MIALGLYLARHGETEASLNRVRSGGDCETILTELGRGQARSLGQRLVAQHPRPGLILVAPLERTMQTALIINESLGVDLVEDEGFCERSLGDWNGKSYDETEELMRAGVTPPGGEASVDFSARVTAAFARHSRHWSRWPLVVSSKGISRVVFEAAGIGLPVLDTGTCVRLLMDGNGDVSRSSVDGAGTL